MLSQKNYAYDFFLSIAKETHSFIILSVEKMLIPDRIEIGFTQFANIFGKISGDRTIDKLLEPYFTDIDWNLYPNKRDQIVYLLKTYQSHSTDLRNIVQTIIDAHGQSKWIERLDLINDSLYPINLKIIHTDPDKNKVEIIVTGETNIITKNSSITQTNPKNWDVFISHASEDKESIARPLAEGLRNKGLRVWYDEYTLKMGDGLRSTIDKGLNNSRYGIVILSKAFFAKKWPQKELDGLYSLEEEGNKVILPIWHEVTEEEVKCYSPSLAGRLSANSKDGIEKIVKMVLDVVEISNPIPTSLSLDIPIPQSSVMSDHAVIEKIKEINEWLPPTTEMISKTAISGDFLKMGLNAVLLRRYLEKNIPELDHLADNAKAKKELALEYIAFLEDLLTYSNFIERAIDKFHAKEIDEAIQLMEQSREYSKKAKVHLDRSNELVV